MGLLSYVGKFKELTAGAERRLIGLAPGISGGGEIGYALSDDRIDRLSDDAILLEWFRCEANVIADYCCTIGGERQDTGSEAGLTGRSVEG